MKERNLADELFTLHNTVFESSEWQEIEKKEFSLGPDQLLDEMIDKDQWSNAEIMWIIKRMIFFYGKKDAILKRVPVERLFNNMIDVMRCFYILIDRLNPELDVTTRKYLTTKLADATWGINSRTREYLYKIEDKN